MDITLGIFITWVYKSYSSAWNNVRHQIIYKDYLPVDNFNGDMDNHVLFCLADF